MQENQEKINQSFSNPVIQLPSKSNNFLIILLSILLVISVVILGFFVYQTQQLTNELRVMSDELKQTPTPTPTYEPGTEPEPVPLEVLTKDWKTYTNEKYKFSFKYPKEWTGSTDPVMSGAQYISLITFDTKLNPRSELRVALFPNIKNINDWANTIKDSGLIYAKVSETKTINGNIFYDVYGLANDLNSKDYFVKADTNGYIKLSIEPYTDIDHKEIFDQILSTFRFLN